MIDHRLRNERLLAEAADPEVAVILFDVVLGYGSHADPAAEMAPALAGARKKNRSVAFVASVCGTDEDPQGLERQEQALRKAGVLLAGSNARAVLLAKSLVGMK
jgi:FdrA protein